MNHKKVVLIVFFTVLLCVVSISFLSSCSQKTDNSPPIAKIVPWADTIFNDIRNDNYYWLKEKQNPEVISYLEAENNYTNNLMAHTEPLQEKLYNEMVARIKETDLSVPILLGDYYYYYRTEEGKQYRIYCRKKGSLEADEEILLNLNELAVGKNYLDLGAYKISPDQKMLGYSIDEDGSEEYTIYFKNLETGELLTDQITSTYYALEWANDNKTIFYTTMDHAKRPDKLHRHILGTSQSDDQLIYQEQDEKFWLYISKTKSKQYLFLTLESNVTSEVRYLKSNNPTGKFRTIHPRQQDMEYSVYHHAKKFYIRTNDEAINFKLMEVAVRNPAKKYWKETIAHTEPIMLSGIDMFKDHMVVYERNNGLTKIRIRNFINNDEYYIEFPEPVFTVYGTSNHEFNTNKLRFSYMSMVTPKSVYDYDMSDKSRNLLKQTEVLGGYNPEYYQSERIFAKASDGTLIPISLVYKKRTGVDKDRINKDGDNCLWLYGYGSYGSSMDPYFSSNRISLLDRNMIYAIAHVRGGGEMGRRWYEQGKYLNKKNTFTDFIACAEHLVKEKYTKPEKMVASGGSAGGLLMGAVLNMRSDLFKAAIAAVPFVDVVTTMLDSTIPLTVTEFEEWGNPYNEDFYWYMKSYSPYDNVKLQPYTNILITAGLNDPRVQYWEPAKWTAKLRAAKTDDNRLLLKTNMGAGHMGYSGRYDYLKDVAFRDAFMLDMLGMLETK